MCDKNFIDELEKEIMLVYETMVVKKALLEECREKLQSEIAEHKETHYSLSKYIKENKELRTQLEISLKAVKKLEEENNKCRDHLVKLQVQTDSYLAERQLLLDKCYQAEVASNKQKNEIIDLKEQLKTYVVLLENYKTNQTQTEGLVNEILSKQEILNKEQKHLESVCGEGLQFATKVSEEAKFQAKFVLEANKSRIQLEEKLIQLTVALKELKSKKENLEVSDEPIKFDYLEEWKIYQEEAELKIQELTSQNNRLMEELNLATLQINLLMTKKK